MLFTKETRIKECDIYGQNNIIKSNTYAKVVYTIGDMIRKKIKPNTNSNARIYQINPLQCKIFYVGET